MKVTETLVAGIAEQPPDTVAATALAGAARMVVVDMPSPLTRVSREAELAPISLRQKHLLNVLE
jgi:hypothetical protein